MKLDELLRKHHPPLSKHKQQHQAYRTFAVQIRFLHHKKFNAGDKRLLLLFFRPEDSIKPCEQEAFNYLCLVLVIVAQV